MLFYRVIIIAMACSLVAIVYALLKSRWIKKLPVGDQKLLDISGFIREGADAFLKREYIVLIPFTIIVALFLAVGNSGTMRLQAISFVLGAFTSALTGYFGMKTATKANSRTAWAAKDGLNPALKIAFTGGSVMGMMVVGLALIGICIVLAVFSYIFPAGSSFFTLNQTIFPLLSGFGLGASSIALFARVGGGIFTKAADVGADLVGKVEVGIPEDDPRNPAVIADNVGDNVGDVAGMGADLFESYVGVIIGCIILGASIDKVIDTVNLRLALLPILLSGVGIIASIFGTFFVRTKEGKSPQLALNKGSFIATVLAIIFLFPVVYFTLGGNTFYDGKGAFHICISAIIGLISGTLIGLITEFYTGTEWPPVKKIEKACITGSATTIISGLGVGMLSTFFPILTIAAALITSYLLAGFYGIGIAALGMLMTLGIQLSVDAYGPIADNAGGLAVMSEMDHSVRNVTDQLDAVGNTTAAIGKGFAIGSAALTSIILISAFTQSISHLNLIFSITNPYIMTGLLMGGTIPFLFSAFSMSAVGVSAGVMIEEVRRQFREKPGILHNTEKPNYSSCVDIATKTALKKMLLPGIIAVISPIVIGFLGGIEMLVGLLVGSTLVGVLLAIFMANAGGAWDNAKKRIEATDAGKGSEMHKAAVVGDTVGDPFKDTAGPSLNTLIKLMAIIALVIAPMLENFWR